MSSPLKQLKAATSLHDLALLLDIKPSSLSYTLYKIPPESKYRQFEIKKRSGGTRLIEAPIKRLKIIQRRLATLLYQCQAEITLAKPPTKSISHGFKKEHSIATNAFAHKKRRFVFNADIEDFFPSFNFGRVRGFFIKNRDYLLNERIATIIAQIACHRNSLPQGSPCSPVISDIVVHLLDIRLAQLAKKAGCTYTRYVDDLTFSTNLKAFPSSIAKQERSALWVVGNELAQTIDRGGFKINFRKTRMQYRNSRQTVTGLTVNRKVNIRADYYRLGRAMCDRLFKAGKFEFVPPIRSIDKAKKTENSLGMTVMRRLINALASLFRKQHLSAVTLEKTARPSTLKRLEGVINHIDHIKDISDRRPETKKRSNPSPIRKLYRALLFFKYFVDYPMPLIVGEGKTDNIYLSLAIKRLANSYPQLFDLTNKKSKIHLFNRRTRRVQQVLKLEPGSAGLAFLIKDYETMMKRYRYKPLPHPVIILIDNDKGAKDVFDAIKTATGKTISWHSSHLFYHLMHNLYLVKTPEAEHPHHESCIEDLFDTTVRAVELSKKKFNSSNDHDTETEYGKAAFAEHVVVPNADKIDFSSFKALLDRIVAAMGHYKSPSPVSPSPPKPATTLDAA